MPTNTDLHPLIPLTTPTPFAISTSWPYVSSKPGLSQMIKPSTFTQLMNLVTEKANGPVIISSAWGLLTFYGPMCVRSPTFVWIISDPARKWIVVDLPTPDFPKSIKISLPWIFFAASLLFWNMAFSREKSRIMIYFLIILRLLSKVLISFDWQEIIHSYRAFWTSYLS